MISIDGLTVISSEESDWFYVNFSYKQDKPRNLAKVFKELAKAIEQRQIIVHRNIHEVKP